MVSLGGIVLVVAQIATPNPGHSINEVPGATPNCATNPSHTFCQPANTLGWGLSDVAIASGYSALSVNSQSFAGRPLGDFCLSTGAGCQGINLYFKGSVAGGGSDGSFIANVACSWWGLASCNGLTFNCQSGYEKKYTGSKAISYQDVSGNPQLTFSNAYICIKN